MKTKAALQPNDKLEFSITITAPVEDWKTLQRQLMKLNEGNTWYGWPLSTVMDQIKEVMARLDKVYHGTPAERSPQETASD